MKALAEQISELDSIVINGRVVGVRGLVMERAMSGRYPAINVLQPVSRTMPRAADQAYLPVLTRARQVMAIYADMEEHSARSLSCRDRPPRSTRLSGCTSRSKLFLPKVSRISRGYISNNSQLYVFSRNVQSLG